MNITKHILKAKKIRKDYIRRRNIIKAQTAEVKKGIRKVISMMFPISRKYRSKRVVNKGVANIINKIMNENMQSFSYVKMIVKGIQGFVIILLSLILVGLSSEYPATWGFVIGSSTLGGILRMALNWIKVKWGVKLPLL